MSKKFKSRKSISLFLVMLVAVLVSALIIPATSVGAVEPAQSTFFGTAFIEEADNYSTPSDGDLWPSAWSNDDAVYLANGDGRGFYATGGGFDSVVSKITSGNPDARNIVGQRLAISPGVIWTAGDYNRKPTGMVSVNGVLYLAQQDLRLDFDNVPKATILKSTNKGVTWTNTATPMFTNYTFTTPMFLDFGKDGVDNVVGSTDDDYVYMYGLDNNWRDSFHGSVTDPTKMYLARTARTSDLQNINNWQFYTGDLNGNATWSAGGAIGSRLPVIQDDRRVYANTTAGFRAGDPKNMSELSQGSFTYNKALNRYIYCSWTEYTFEFFEAPKPWGPWKKFLSKDFGDYPWSDTKNGGYTTVIPSKYISADGKKMWVNANTFMGGVANYNFSLRPLFVTQYTGALANNARSSTSNLAVTGESTTPMTKGSFHQGKPWALNDGIKNVSQDSWNGEAKSEDYWGYTWSKVYNLNKVVYTTGGSFGDGGWFTNLKVQVRRNFVWYDVGGSCAPAYPNNSTANAFKTYTFSFPDTTGDGVRIIGAPGGTEKFTSISELEAYYDGTAPANNIVDNDTGAPGYTTTGTWTTSGNSGYNGTTYQYTSAGSSCTATWNMTIPTTGLYKISAIYKAGTNRATSAKYNIATAAGNQTVYVNQTLNDLAWVTLGTWNFNAGTATITLDAAGSSGGTSPVVIADAIKFDIQQTVSDVIKDDGAAGYSTTGTWTTTATGGYNNGSYQYASAGSAKTATWAPSLPAAGTWRVSVMYKAGTNRATSAKFNVATASGTQSVYVNQTLNNLTWVTLGTWSMNAGGGNVTLDAAGSSGGTTPQVIADAVKFEYISP